MTDLFDTKDLLTVATVEQAEVSTKGYFGDNLSNLIEKVKQGKVETLTDVIPDVTYCFESNNDLHYVFFLPAGKVKIKEPIYRPLESIDELFDFFYPLKDDVYNQTEKAQILIGKKITLKEFSNRTKVTVIQDVEFSNDDADSSNIYLNNLSLEYLFNNFKIQINSEFVPFGIKEK